MGNTNFVLLAVTVKLVDKTGFWIKGVRFTGVRYSLVENVENVGNLLYGKSTTGICMVRDLLKICNLH
jgi:hypothetical protein